MRSATAFSSAALLSATFCASAAFRASSRIFAVSLGSGFGPAVAAAGLTALLVFGRAGAGAAVVVTAPAGALATGIEATGMDAGACDAAGAGSGS